VPPKTMTERSWNWRMSWNCARAHPARQSHTDGPKPARSRPTCATGQTQAGDAPRGETQRRTAGAASATARRRWEGREGGGIGGQRRFRRQRAGAQRAVCYHSEMRMSLGRAQTARNKPAKEANFFEFFIFPLLPKYPPHHQRNGEDDECLRSARAAGARGRGRALWRECLTALVDAA